MEPRVVAALAPSLVGEPQRSIFENFHGVEIDLVRGRVASRPGTLRLPATRVGPGHPGQSRGRYRRTTNATDRANCRSPSDQAAAFATSAGRWQPGIRGSCKLRAPGRRCRDGPASLSDAARRHWREEASFRISRQDHAIASGEHVTHRHAPENARSRAEIASGPRREACGRLRGSPPGSPRGFAPPARPRLAADRADRARR